MEAEENKMKNPFPDKENIIFLKSRKLLKNSKEKELLELKT